MSERQHVKRTILNTTPPEATMISATEMARACNGNLINSAHSGNLCFDTRALEPGDWFVVLNGARDGHEFIPAAAEKGCAGIIGSRVPEGWDRGFIQVNSGLMALQDIAKACRKRFHKPVIGITGSAGKTTTRALVAWAINSLGPVHQTAGNFNNHIGLPLTITNAPQDTTAWVLEMGMNALGEIDLLQDICKPTVRLITNIGAAHVEGCGSIEGVARAKGELFDGSRPGDICCINIDDHRVASLPLPSGVRRWTYGCNPDADVRLLRARILAESLSTEVELSTPNGCINFTLPAPGYHLAHNAAAAATVALALGVSVDKIAAGLEQYKPVGDRLRPVSIGSVSLINDAYNANPISMIASLELLHTISEHRPVLALLGDMLELGDLEAQAHKEVLIRAKELGLDVGCAGPLFGAAAADLGHTLWAQSSTSTELAEQLVSWLSEPESPKEISVLLKGSRGLRMEKIEQLLSVHLAGETQ